MGVDLTTNICASALMGWANPLKVRETAPNLVIDFRLTFETAVDALRWGDLIIATDDAPIANNDVMSFHD